MSSPSDDSQPSVGSPNDHGQSLPEMFEALRESFARQAEHTRELQEALKKQTDAMKSLEQKVQTLDKSHEDEVIVMKQKINALQQSLSGSGPSSAIQTDPMNSLKQDKGAPKQPSSAPGPSTQSKPSAGPAPPPRRGRNLVVCIDGTSNQFSIKNTNVVELYHRLIKDKTQLTYYNSGIGTYAEPSWKSLKYYKLVLINKIDLAIAWNFDNIVLSAYRWLSENYEDGDVIYLFGFSRGAYQIRTLAAMIDSVGLIHKGNQDQIGFAYELYLATGRPQTNTRAKGKSTPGQEAADVHPVLDASAEDNTGRLADTDVSDDASSIRSTTALLRNDNKKKTNPNTMCRHFKATFSREVTVHFAGAWDTVSSVGLIRDKTLPETTNGMQHVTYFRHALALHERRIKFLNENVRGGLGPTSAATRRDNNREPHTKEVWFAGSHGDIGGGAKDNLEMNQFGPALRWMLFEATVAGLRLTDAPQYWDNNPPKIHNTLRGIWRLFEYLPFTRLSYGKEIPTVTSRPHLGRPRQIQEHQLIHETALGLISELFDDSTRWRAQLPRQLRWTKTEFKEHGLIEEDPYTAANHYIEKIAKPDFSTLSRPDVLRLKTLVSTGAGRSSIRDIETAREKLNTALLGVLSKLSVIEPDQQTLPTIDVLLEAMERCNFIDEDYIVPEARTYAARIAGTDETLARKFLTLCGSAMVGNPFEHPYGVISIAYMPGGDRLVSGCEDGAVCVCDLKTGEIVGDPMRGHTNWVLSVAVSADGMRIASGSADTTIRVWSVETGTEIALLEGHSRTLRSVAFSPDGSRVVSGSDDDTIRVWDVATAKTVVGPIQGHSNSVRSVAYSPEGSRIVSGAVDGTVRLWNAETGEQLWQAVMSSSVLSVAYSTDSKRIVAGCLAGAVHVLDAATGEIVLGSFTGRFDAVNSVAFSPDGKKIASASEDRTIRLWDAETGAALDVIRGHREEVPSVAFSPDGKRVASALWDKTVRIWDATGEWKRW